MKVSRKGLLAAALAVVVVTAAHAAGIFSMYPIVGSGPVCVSTVTGATSFGGQTGQGQGTGGSICAQTMPAGPTALTGTELIAADTGLQTPATVTIPSSLLGSSVNRLIGGDMTTNLAQRLNSTKGIAALATLSPTAAVITADRWWVIAPAAGVTATIDSTAATAVIPGFNNTKALRIARTTSGAAGNMCVGQTLDAAASAPLIGNNAVFSFFEQNGPAQSATNGNITVNVDYTSAADTAGTQATLGFAGANGSLFALGDVGLLSAGPTNMTRAIAGASPGTTGTVTAGVATIAGSTAWTRYSVYAPIPVNIPGTTTPVTSVSVSICFAPILTTAITTDWIEINGMQLEAKPSTVTASLPAGVVSPTSFERRPFAIEQYLQQQYWFFLYESQTAITTVASCDNVTTSLANCLIPFPEQMRITPVVKYTAGFQAFVQIAETSVGACTALAASTSYVTAPSNLGVLAACTAATVGAAGTPNKLTTLGTASATGIISASAEP